jgi:hypothetical protein
MPYFLSIFTEIVFIWFYFDIFCFKLLPSLHNKLNPRKTDFTELTNEVSFQNYFYTLYLTSRQSFMIYNKIFIIKISVIETLSK